jgi:hypothetical protein
MRAILAAVAFSLLLTPFAVLPACADQTYLSATFDDKTVGQPLSMGGAAVGEPTSMTATAADTVRAAPFPSPCLELVNHSPTGGAYLNFQFLDAATVTSGLVVISMELWLPQTIPSNGYWVQLYPRNDWTHRFAALIFRPNGQLMVMDYDGFSGGSNLPGSYPTGRAFPLMMAFDMNAGTYSIWVDNVRVVTDEGHGITGYGISQFEVGSGANTQDYKFWLDSVQVTDSFPDVPVHQSSWGSVKASFRR